MAFPPPPHPNTRPMKEAAPFDPAGDRAFLKGWLAHVEAGRIGKSRCRPTAALLEAGPPMSEETSAAIPENERVIRGDRG